MTGSYQLSRDAERDVIDVYLYTLETFGEAQADKYVDALYDRFAEIAGNTVLGRDFGMIHPGALRANYVSHAIYYRQSGQSVLILRILHQSMDPARHLE